jgi:hypothetical protein
MRAEAASNDGVVTLQVDLANAFNTFSRADMMTEVLQRCLALARFVWYLYGAHSRLWISGARLDEPPVLICAGVRQRDPLSPLMFALVLNHILEHLSKFYPDCLLAAYAHDVVLQGTPFLFSKNAAPSGTVNVGLQVNAQKCNVNSHSHGAAQSVAATSSVKHATHGIFVAGTPLGNDDFILEYDASTTEDAQCAVQKLLTLPMPAQCQWAVLRGSLQHRVVHLPRVARWAQVENALTDTPNAVADAALKIGQCQVQPGSATDRGARVQLELPMRHGGKVLHRLSPAEGSEAFLSSAALTNVAIAKAPEQFRPVDGPADMGSPQEEWQDVARTCCSYRLPRRYRGWSMPAHGAATGTEGHFTCHGCTSLALAYCSSRLERPTQARAASQGASPQLRIRDSSIWLTALPLRNPFQLWSMPVLWQ